VAITDAELAAHFPAHDIAAARARVKGRGIHAPWANSVPPAGSRKKVLQAVWLAAEAWIRAIRFHKNNQEA
jgi:hypothetical protein